MSDPGPLYLQIGSQPNTINYLAEGMDELALFDDVLTPSEVTAIYNNGAPTDLISHSGLKHYYRMGEAIGDTAALIRDQKGHWNLNGIQATPALDTDVPYVVITSITPYYAVAGTASVTIKGYNFNGVNTSTGVTIGGTACTSISITDSETIVVTIPAGSGTQERVRCPVALSMWRLYPPGRIPIAWSLTDLLMILPPCILALFWIPPPQPIQFLSGPR